MCVVYITLTLMYQLECISPSDYPLSDLLVIEKYYPAKGPLVSGLPWRFPNTTATLRHLRLDIYLPNPYDTRLWNDTLAQRLSKFVQSVENGVRLRDLRILIASWYHFGDLSTRQAAVLGILGQIRTRGHIQIKTRSLGERLRSTLRDLDILNKMRDVRTTRSDDLSHVSNDVAEDDMDWDWEGGVLV